ncbi:MAG: alpha/beta hydrolase [Phenylobacterium sp.]|uniref:alpha/beta fold hydrolase n=1 Tax=Phenylobacterium sp. TaxID=1871053 RepID=UPI002736C971|nr:alpha/beta hydrolase [Phenylobacterium sp.]MDP3747383.1 alpha/beta hydrolase [Phenylobacterium sp.]
MPRLGANGIFIEYESFGAERDEVVLLINGLGAQMTRWPEPFCQGLSAEGLRVVRFDNRDVGLSTWLEAGARYSLADMAQDAVGLMDGLRIHRAHIVGLSMGGMIGQTLAATHPNRALSLTSIMSSTGNPDLPRPTAEAIAATQRSDLRPEDGEPFVAAGVKATRAIEGPGFPWAEAQIRRRVTEEAARAFNPEGVGRQRKAVVTAGDRREQLRTISAPTVVLHGAEDPLARVECGRDTAAVIPGAELLVVPGMGHSLPPQLHEVFKAAILRAVARGRHALSLEAMSAR